MAALLRALVAGFGAGGAGVGALHHQGSGQVAMEVAAEGVLVPTTPRLALTQALNNYNVFLGPSSSYCSGEPLESSSSTGKEECEARCTGDFGCQYFSLWATGGLNWCHLTVSCTTTGDMPQQPGHTISVYRKQADHVPVHRKLHRQEIFNHEDMLYTAPMTVGGQNINGILDTGSFELLVFENSCASCGSTESFYDSSESTTYERFPSTLAMMHSFGSGDTWSQLAWDNFAMGPMTVQGQYFWDVQEADLPILETVGNFQAIVGVGPTSTTKNEYLKAAADAEIQKSYYVKANVPVPSDIVSETQYNQALAEQTPLLDRLGVSMFSVCLGRESGTNGVFVWNDADPRTMPSIFTPLPAGAIDGHWSAVLADVRFEGGSGAASLALACESGCGAVIDSGTSVLAVPPDVADRAIALINSIEGLGCDDISAYPRLEFTLGGNSYVLPPEAYIFEVEQEVQEPGESLFRWRHWVAPVPLCTLGMITMDMTTSAGPLWIMGMPFFREYYTTFHLGDNETDRSLYTAPASEECTPALLAMAMAQEAALRKKGLPKRPRKVNLAKVHTPSWVQRLAKT